jgi:hypothetical protein
MMISHLVEDKEINYVLLGTCDPTTVDELRQSQMALHGNVLSI